MSRRDQALTRTMGALFAIGSACFVAAPIGAYARAVGAHADAVTYFVGSILFTLGGATQTLLALPERDDARTGLDTWRAAWIQSLGTLLFNVMTFAAITIAPSSDGYDRIVWAANALGSLCFLLSGWLLYRSAPRRGLLPQRRHKGWWEPAVNMLGCVLFGLSAASAFGSGHPGELLSPGLSNATTALGALCFMSCGAAACGLGRTLKAPRMRELRVLAGELEHVVERDEQTLERRIRRLI